MSNRRALAIRRALKAWVAALLSLLGGCGDVSTLSETGTPGDIATQVASRTSPVAALSATSAEGFSRALEVRPFTFPADHGPHPNFAVEWWYLTGNLQTDSDRRFGYQLTFFRRALAPAPATSEPPPRASAWATRQVYLAHFALTDVAGQTFFTDERTARGAMGLAGAQAEPFRVWLEDWAIEADNPANTPFPARARAVGSGFAIDLALAAIKPPVLNGDQGLSAKGSTPGNASYYYSLPRLASRGTVAVGAQSYAVTGSSWLDREWSTSLLEPGQIGWDWFALQLSDGRDLMTFQLRRGDGSIEQASHGTLTATDGSARHLAVSDFTMTVLDHWQSPMGIGYPSRWRVAVPSAAIDLIVTPLLADQEFNLSFRYWEGAVEIQGTASGEPATGKGYVELVGYGPDSAP